MELTLEEFKKEYSNIADALIAEGRQMERDESGRHTMARREQLSAIGDNPLPGDHQGQDCKHRWEADQGLRDEFIGDFEAYLAYETAMNKGLVRILGRK